MINERRYRQIRKANPYYKEGMFQNIESCAWSEGADWADHCPTDGIHRLAVTFLSITDTTQKLFETERNVAQNIIELSKGGIK